MNLKDKLITSSRASKTVLLALLFTSGVSLVRAAFYLGYYYNVFECMSSPDFFCPISFHSSFLLGAALGLCLATLGLWSRRWLGLLLSSIALLWVVIVYVMWYAGTFSVMQMAEVQHFSQLPKQPQYLLPLDEATWWDIVVLVIALLVLLWQVGNFWQILKPRQMTPKENSDERLDGPELRSVID